MNLGIQFGLLILLFFIFTAVDEVSKNIEKLNNTLRDKEREEKE